MNSVCAICQNKGTFIHECSIQYCSIIYPTGLRGERKTALRQRVSCSLTAFYRPIKALLAQGLEYLLNSHLRFVTIHHTFSVPEFHALFNSSQQKSLIKFTIFLKKTQQVPNQDCFHIIYTGRCSSFQSTFSLSYFARCFFWGASVSRGTQAKPHTFKDFGSSPILVVTLTVCRQVGPCVHSQQRRLVMKLGKHQRVKQQRGRRC